MTTTLPAGWKPVLVDRSYDMRVKALIAFNTAEQAGKDRDDALNAAFLAMIEASPPPPASPLSAAPASAQEEAKDERQDDACPRCHGSGEITVMSDNSPDAYDVDVCCDHCQGSGAAADAAKYLAAALSGEKFRHMQLWAEYRNFHRSLCARFGYGHDEVHFRRDLVSLEEAIAAKVAAPAAGDALDVNALMAAEYQQWIDWYHQGRDYDSFLKERVNAAIAAQQGKGGEA